ncbi:MAG: hypothetical protein HOP29_13325 [Phycisphaerales bacterium]|nr:hypothetical protein [Phycisphaerales bacterium]
MKRESRPWRWTATLLAGGLTIVVVRLVGCVDVPDVIPPGDPGAAGLNVSGEFRYTGLAPFFNLSGTITFEQDDDVVRVTMTTYDAGTDRPLIGAGALSGNVLNIVLVPENGDTNYRADVEFIFGENGDTFSVAFSDTNGDIGGPGSYSGQRVIE